MSEAAGSTRPGWTPTRLIAFFTGNRVAGRLLMLVLLIGGVYTALQLEVAMLPELETGEIAVTVPYPGASPAEVAEDVNRRIEERLIALEGVERTTSSGSRPWSRWPLVDVQARAGRQLTRWRDNWVAPAIAAAVRRPSLTLVAGAGLVAATVALLATGVVRSDPNTGLSYSQIQVDLEFPPGTPVAATSAAADRVADIARQPSAWTDAIRTVTVVVGQQLVFERLFGIEQQPATGGHLATVLANVVHESQRSLSMADIERLWLAAIGNVPGALGVRATTANVATEAAYAISHPEPAELAAATTEIRRSLDAYPGVQDVSDTLTPGALQYDVELTEAGETAGLSARALAGQLRARLHGIDVQRIQRGREEVRVRVRYPPSDRQSLRELRD